MFLCTQCLEQFEESHLAYTMILESRLTHPAMEMFVLKFCSKTHIQQFLDRIRNQGQRYVLTIKSPGGNRSLEPGLPRDLLLLVGSSKAS